MRITIIFRPTMPSGYSIERVFENIISEIAVENEVTIFRPNPAKSLVENLRQLYKIPTDIYHITGHVNYYALFLPRKKTVLTIHDIGHIRSLKGWKSWLYSLIWLKWPFKRVAKLTTVSENTKNDVCNTLGIKPTKIDVIPNAISPLFTFKTKVFNKVKPNILQVGTKPYKNVPRLIEALSGINCTLTLIGKIDVEIQMAIEKFNTNCINLFDVSDEEIIKQYEKCDMVSFVSLGEGFGVPIIEANAIGRPIITAIINPMAQVAGNAACLVNPLSVTEITNGIKKIINDETYREQLIINGLKNALNYDSKSIAVKYVNLYKTLI